MDQARTTTTTSNDHAKQTHLSQRYLCLSRNKTKEFDHSTRAKVVTQSSKMAYKCSNSDANNLLPATLLTVQDIKHNHNHHHHNYHHHNYHHHHRQHHDNNHQRTTKPAKLRLSFVRLTMIVLLCLATSDTRWSQVKAQTSLLGSPMYLSSSSLLARSSNQAAGNMAADTSDQSSILKRDLSGTIKQQQQRNVCQVNDGESVAIVEIEESRGSDMSQLTNPIELPISGSVGRGEIELKIESETHKYFQIQDKRLKLMRPLDRDAVLKENSTQIQQHPISSIYLQISCLDKRSAVSDTVQQNRKVIIPVLVKVLDLNDNAPKFSLPVYTVQVDELTPVGSLIADQIQAVDLDSSNNGYIEYSLVVPPTRQQSLQVAQTIRQSQQVPSLPIAPPRLVQRAQPEAPSQTSTGAPPSSTIATSFPSSEVSSSTAPATTVEDSSVVSLSSSVFASPPSTSSSSAGSDSFEDFHTTTAASSGLAAGDLVTKTSAPTINMNSEPILNRPIEDAEEEESDEALLASLNSTSANDSTDSPSAEHLSGIEMLRPTLTSSSHLSGRQVRKKRLVAVTDLAASRVTTLTPIVDNSPSPSTASTSSDWTINAPEKGQKSVGSSDLWTNLMAANLSNDDLMLADRPQLTNLEYKLTAAAAAAAAAVAAPSTSNAREPDSDSGDYFALEMAPNGNRPLIKLKRALDYESRRVHVLSVMATDRAINRSDRLSSTALVIVKVMDGDDQAPAFVLDQQGCATGSVPQPTTSSSMPFAAGLSSDPLEEQAMGAPVRRSLRDIEDSAPVLHKAHNVPKGFKVTDENFDFSDMSTGDDTNEDSEQLLRMILQAGEQAPDRGPQAAFMTTTQPRQPPDWAVTVPGVSLRSSQVNRHHQHQQQRVVATATTKSHYIDYSCLSSSPTAFSSSGQAEYFATIMSGDSDYLLRVGPQAIKARDRDELNAPIRYSFLNGTPANYSSFFQINPLDASIKQIAPVERQQVDKFVILVQAQEQTVNKLASFARLTIDVIPSDKNPPVLVPNAYGGFVEENAPIGVSVMVLATDQSNRGAPLTETGRQVLNLTVPMRINVLDADYSTGVGSLQMGSSSSSQRSAQLYEFETTSDAFKVNKDGFVYVNKSPLDRDPPNQAIHTFQVTARQLGLTSSRSISSPVSINVTLLDLNDNPPTILNSSLVPIQLTANSGSSATVSRLVTTIKAADKDLAENSRMSFSIHHVSNGGKERFRIEEDSGRLEALGKFQAGEQFSLTIQVSDDLGRSSQGILEVIIIPGPNTGGPQFIVESELGLARSSDNSRGYSVEVNEGVAPHSAILQVRASDPENDPIAYGIVDGNINNDFYINSKSGLIYVANKLDREEVSAYNLLVQARDSGGLATNRPVHISITDNNDQNPIFQQTQYVFSIKEGVQNRILGRVLANDGDAGENGQISYHLSESGSSLRVEGQPGQDKLFSIDEQTGEIKLTGALDYEQAKSHTLIVVAKDHGENPRSTTTSVLVRVIDAQDEAPYFERYYFETRLQENLAQHRIAQVSARDPDSVAQVTYVIKSGDTSLFSIDPQTGVVSTLRGLDFEQSRSHTVIVGTIENQEPDLVEAANVLANAISSGQQLERSPICRIDIAVIDINDNVPQFVSQPLPVRIQDSAQLGTVIARLIAEDRDGSEPNNQMRYELVAKADNNNDGSTSDRCLNAFMIDATSGAISLKADLKRDSQSECSLLIRVRDLGQQPLSLSSTIGLTIFIDHIAEISSASMIGFADSSFTVEIEENAPSNSLVKVLPIVNKPKNNFPMSCEIVSGNELAKFYVMDNEQRDCELRVRDHAVIDYELKQRYTLMMRLNTIGSNPKTLAQVNINILDKNDNRPLFYQPSRYSHLTQGRFLAAIPNDAPSETQVLQLRASDFDSPHSNGLVSYEILNDIELEGRFKVDAIDGIVRTSRPVEDVLSTRLPLRLKVLARDNPEVAANSLDSVAEVVINLIDDRHRIALVLKDTTTGRALDSKEELLSAIQERTGLISGLEKAESLKIQRNGTFEPDVSGTDFWFYLIEPGTFRIVSNDDLRVRSTLLDQRPQSSLVDIIGQTLGFTKARIRLPYSMTGGYGRAAGSTSARGAFGSADNLASVLIMIALFFAIISAIIVVYQCGFLSSYAHSEREKAYLQQQQQQQQHSPGSSYFPGLAGCAIKSQQNNCLTMSSQQNNIRSPFSTLPSAHQIAPNSLIGARAENLINNGKQSIGEANIYQLEPSQANNNLNAALSKEYETQMLKMSVLFDDSHSLDDQNLYETGISKNHLT